MSRELSVIFELQNCRNMSYIKSRHCDMMTDWQLHMMCLVWLAVTSDMPCLTGNYIWYALSDWQLHMICIVWLATTYDMPCPTGNYIWYVLSNWQLHLICIVWLATTSDMPCLTGNYIWYAWSNLQLHLICLDYMEVWLANTFDMHWLYTAVLFVWIVTLSYDK